jgi:N-acetylglucosamine transport system substrate-binding protein
MSVPRIRTGLARPPGSRLIRPGTGAGLHRRTVLGRAAGAGLLLTPAASLLAACATGGDGDDNGGSGDPTADNPFGYDPTSAVDTVFFTGGFGDQYPDAMAEAFQARYPDAQVAALGTETIATEMQPRFASGNPPDVLNNSGDDQLTIDGLVNDGAVLALTDLMDAPSIDDPNVTVRDSLVTGVEQQGLFGGTMYTLNYALSTYGMWYNAALFREHGWTPPTTWGEFLALAEEVQEAGIAPFIHQGQHPWYMHNVLMEWIYREGGLPAVLAIDNLEPDAWHQPAVEAAAARVQELVDAGLVYPGAEGLDHIQSQQAWLDGEAAFIWCGSWLESEMAETIPDGFEMSLAPPWAPSDNPATPAGTMRVAPGEPFVVPADAANTAGGLEFLRVMCSKAAANRFSELTSSFSVVKDTGQTVDSTALRSAAQAAADSPENIDWKWIAWYEGPMFVDTMEPTLGEVMAGRATATELLDAMQQAADAVAADASIEKFTRQA